MPFVVQQFGSIPWQQSTSAIQFDANVTGMARLARIVVRHLPHHVTQRGNRRQPIFFQDGDHDVYRDLMAVQMRKANIEV